MEGEGGGDNGNRYCNNEELIEYLHQYCALATENRDPSHGVAHMDQVRNISLLIWQNERLHNESLINIERIERLIITTSQLHDVLDHKYPSTSFNNEETFRKELQKYFPDNDIELILLIIQNISYSKEVKLRNKLNSIPLWEELGPDGQLVRNIVSDADKLEAIGMIGIQRCLQYSYETMKHRDEEINVNVLFDHLVEHGNEKLFILKDEYIRTLTGKKMAEIPHNIMLDEVDRLKQLQQNNFTLFEIEMMKHIYNSYLN